jgi:hypothetical protein
MSTEQLKSNIINQFPDLNSDSKFRISSSVDFKYNCIAYALIITDKWVWPLKDKDGIWWPEELPKNIAINTFIKLFELKSYSVCENGEMEDGFQKIVIYTEEANPNEVTHAARQLNDGNWTSKLGSGNDIIHSDPSSIEGEIYGKVSTFMKRMNLSFQKSKPKPKSLHKRKKKR